MASQRTNDTPRESKTETLTLKLAPKQRKIIDERAKRCGVSTSVWLRSIAMQAATRQASEGYLRIKEPDGVTI